ncbi:hypothetical protein [Corynebacterium sp. A21]|uniref:hypothetical protein n=1 Tax=Corynebacterium sp. A21 TaxID=3457318 RepID=UPI003FD25E3E
MAASSEVASAEEPEAAEQDFLGRQLAKLKSDAPKQRVLIRMEGEPGVDGADKR